VLTSSLFIIGCIASGIDLGVNRETANLHKAAFEKLLAYDSVDTGVRGYCLGIQSAANVIDPPDDVMTAFRRHSPPVWRISECANLHWEGLEVHDTASIVLQSPQILNRGVNALIEGWMARGAAYGERVRCEFIRKGRSWTLDRCDVTGIS